MPLFLIFGFSKETPKSKVQKVLLGNLVHKAHGVRINGFQKFWGCCAVEGLVSFGLERVFRGFTSI